MKANQIEEGGRYRAKVSGIIVTVKVLKIGKRAKNAYRQGGTYYVCQNEKTGREIVFKSAQRFRSEVCYCTGTPGGLDGGTSAGHVYNLQNPKPTVKWESTPDLRPRPEHIREKPLAAPVRPFTEL